jgi:hypothetical protein
MDPKTWESFSEHAHRACFSEIKPREWDRIDYALLATNEEDDPCGYMTCRELDSKTVYWQFGGAFKPIKGTINSMRVYESFINWHKERYDRVCTYIENDNRAMLKMASFQGFKITGVRNYAGQVLLEHILEFEKGDYGHH